MEIIDPGGNGKGASLEVIMTGGSENDYYENILKMNKFIGNSFTTNINDIFKPAILTTNVNSSQIISLNVINGGSGYWFTPKIQFISGDGVGAVLLPILDGNTIKNVQVLNSGNYYNYPPRIKTESPNPNLFSMFQQNEVFGKVLFFQDDRIFCVLNTDKNSFSPGSISFRGINIDIGNVNVFTTKGITTKYTYPTEIEVI
ncbi:MAG: hypothetical protein N3A54_05945 [Patescibacteria group bacterium]|nr:hypothetical protein [Patescibacteria group bacterium]